MEPELKEPEHINPIDIYVDVFRVLGKSRVNPELSDCIWKSSDLTGPDQTPKNLTLELDVVRVGDYDILIERMVQKIFQETPQILNKTGILKYLPVPERRFGPIWVNARYEPLPETDERVQQALKIISESEKRCTE